MELSVQLQVELERRARQSMQLSHGRGRSATLSAMPLSNILRAALSSALAVPVFCKMRLLPSLSASIEFARGLQARPPMYTTPNVRKG